MQQVDISPRKLITNPKRASWFVSLLLVFVIASASVITWVALNNLSERLETDVEYSLTPPVQSRSASIVVWYGELTNQIKRLVDTDMIRLFATEVNELGPRLPAMLRLKERGHASPIDSDPAARLASQIPLMQNMLEMLVAQSDDLISGSMVTSDLQPYIGTESSTMSFRARLTQEMLDLARQTVETGKRGTLPVQQAIDNRLTMVISHPIFAPDYISRSAGQVVGVLLLTCDVSQIIRTSTFSRGDLDSNHAARVLQNLNGELIEMMPDSVTPMRVLPGWQANEIGNLPLEERSLPDGEKVYSLGLPTSGLPWIVAQDVTTAAIQEHYETERDTLIFVIGACAVIVALFLGMFWWWLVGRRERAVSDELKQLYQTVNQQHELISGINSTLADGIMLLDRQGAIKYANEAFAAMSGRSPESMVGRKLADMFDEVVADRIFRNTSRVLRLDAAETFTEVLLLADGKHHYQVACSPFHSVDGSTTGVVAVFRDITELVLAQEHAQNMTHQTVNVLVRAIEAVDPYLRGQSTQTGILAGHLAHHMNLPTIQANTVRAAANLSQIGMIQLPRELVNKTSALTPDERMELQKHVEYARKSLEGIDFGLPVVEAITQMHENMDGSGYPKGLVGDQINVNSRILSVANTFCALVRPRSYRQAHSVNQALAILSETPPKYDPAVVQKLREFLETPTGKVFLESLQAKGGD